MSRKDELIALAGRVEALTGPDRGVDTWIENHLGLARFEPAHPFRSHCDGDTRKEPKPYTASLDAAMSLVPEGYEFTVSMHIGGTGAASIFRRNEDNERETCCRLCVAATPALALTAAALRAIAETEGEQP
jgi:hypothetical protein